MSDILVLDRKNNMHVVDYCSGGHKYTLCGITYTRKDIINTLALDGAVRIGCRKCYEFFSQMYESDLNDNPQTARSSLQDRLIQNYDSIQNNILDTYARYSSILEIRYWHKLSSYKRKHKVHNVSQYK